MTVQSPSNLPVAVLVAELRRLGATLAATGGTLRLSAPKGAVDQALAKEIGARKVEILALLQAEDADVSTSIPIVSRERPLPLGFVQQRMWVHNQLEPDTVLYNLPAAWRLTGALDFAALERALGEVIARHEVLRISVKADGDVPVQTFASSGKFSLPMQDLSAVAADEREPELRARIVTLRDSFIDLEKAAPFVVQLFRLGPAEHVLFFMPHHVVWDGWSFDIFLRDLNETYSARLAGREPSLPALPIQYADYAVWHRQWLESGALEPQMAFWTERLKADVPTLDLPADLPRPRVFTHRGDWEEFAISAATIERIAKLGAESRATSFMVLLAAWYAFLNRITGQADLVVGAPVQARHRPEVTDLVGCLVNTLCLRQTVDPGAEFHRLLDEVRELCVAAYEHQDAPVELLIDRLLVRRDPSRTPLFQAMFSHQQVSRRPHALGNLAVSQVHVNPAATPTDIMLAVMEGANGARGVIHYSTEIFRPETVRALRERFEHFLDAALADPSTPIADLPIMTPRERATILKEWNATAREYPRDASALDLIVRQATATPNAPAVTANGEACTYAELDGRSSRLARHLAEQGVKAGDIVGIHLNRSVDMVAAIHAVWKTGAAYLPLDPGFPPERLRYMLEDSNARLVISHGDLADVRPETNATVIELDADADVIGRQSSEPLAPLAPAPDALAYVLYTSGSTGKPKGVEITQRSLVNFLTSMAREPGLSVTDRLLAVTTLSFDISILEVTLPLTVGAHVIVASRDDVLDGYALRDLMDEHRITVMQATPATWRLLIDSEWSGTARLKALCGGEALPAPLARELLARTGELWNMYGPTETAIWSTCSRITDADRITVGRPIANTSVYILDERQELLPPGIAGELWIGGDGVARGYLGKPELTGERFVPDPFVGGDARMYRTGDWARFLSDGSIEFQRRRDNQVKVRGFRIELGEIETALAAHSSVARTVVVVREDRAGDAKIVAYLVSKGDTATSSELRRWLRRSLPDYMVPHVFVELKQIPLTANGKIDRNALPAPEGLGGAGDVARVAPRNEVEKLIASVWSELLGVREISVTDNFFELGGQSLQAAQMVSRVFKLGGHRIRPRAVVYETLEQLSIAR